jgi:hypothetical protein
MCNPRISDFSDQRCSDSVARAHDDIYWMPQTRTELRELSELT